MVVASDIDRVLVRAVETGIVPGVVALAADDDGVIYAGAFGAREVGAAAGMSLDTVMWIASMTKAVTSVAALQLVEQGRIDLDEPLGERIAALASLQVLEGFDDRGAPRLRATRRPVTLRQLLTHTAGFAYHIWHAETQRYLEYAGIPAIGECQTATLATPIVFDPGERFEYGINIDWVGRIVEHLSGQSLEDYFREHIFAPLRMNDSGFLLRPEQRPRLASLHERQPDGSLAVTEFEMSQQPEFFMGGGGLYSTGSDYLRFIRMLLGAGRLDGARVLRSETVAEIGKNQIGDLSIGKTTTVLPASSNDFEFFPGLEKKWGLASMITMEDAPTGRSAGSLAWGGLANTYYWIDPGKRVAGVLLTQILPFADPGVLDLLARFERGIYASLAARGPRPT
jgi:CubicO group peptidase (beta-lactamase class C family)